MQSRVLYLPRTVKQLVVLSLDVVLALLSTWIAFTLRLDALNWPSGAQWWVYMLAPVVAIPIFIRFGLYRAIFRYTGQAALQATGLAVLVYGCVLTVILLWMQWPMVPRSLGVLQPLVFLFLVGASRALARFWLADLGHTSAQVGGRLLIYGAGTAGVQTAAALRMSQQYALLGFVDDDVSKVGRSLNGIPVFAPSEVPQVVVRQGVTDILLALPSASRDRRNAILDSLRPLPVHIRTLPGLSDLASGRVTVQDIRELDLEDLLGRDPVPPDTALLARDLAAQVVLVTGAGGSIGGELTRQIVLQRPRQLLLLDHNEFGLYSIHQELQGICASQNLGVELIPLLGSVANPDRLAAIFEAYRPATVYHAAAYKHVPMVEGNPGEGILNNVFGTLNTARAAMASGARRFVLISTDKAVRPTNVMGASKRMAELVLQALAMQDSVTCFTMVRFGNVLGSSGSVVPLFRRQLSEGGPLTVTHTEVTRYFMTIPEAAQLVLQAGAMAAGGDVFVLDMGEPVKIIDLARRMVQLSGLSVRDGNHPDGDIEIAVTGLRPGEKLYEELLIGDNPEPTAHVRIMKAHEDYLAWDALVPHLSTLRAGAEQADLAAIKAVLEICVHGYGDARLNL
ncbi:MAG: capsular biosynthesis protein [Burkholderiales bacterium RIFOXYC2_FULL_59_8]|nr:nucleoside-diphosphate sugar epimerase/dehydratase [Rhodoferax sp.]OGB42777.1 MAG: capsular biosynthesis protein [Burkholderiales bacterium RIFOXYC2_FULL_59_8]OGB50058.1 MAG: capsular biosynthesis protein [Burkholderiales bacterium RIFOXYD12_FULL_59_19]OGB76977.1 MAG: capsular biosynthesis protein [Burkholderiales bacterium RIFOXYC12_FULL_60_6]